MCFWNAQYFSVYHRFFEREYPLLKNFEIDPCMSFYSNDQLIAFFKYLNDVPDFFENHKFPNVTEIEYCCMNIPLQKDISSGNH